MKYNHNQKFRKSTRLKEFDYASPGAYFITICVFQRECILGEIEDGKMVLSSAGESTLEIWYDLPSRFPTVELDAFVIMPNHVHGILCLTTNNSETLTISIVLRAFKSLSARAINKELGRAERPAWQRGFWDHINHNEMELERIRTYIHNNPQSWFEDQENPNNDVE
jgi:REP element-mobilizing transposase RayT